MSTRISTQRNRQLARLTRVLDGILAPFVGEGLLLAISGGPDSRALLESVARWAGRQQGAIFVATCDHQVRQQSRAESEFVAMRAKRLGFRSFCLPIMPLGGAGEHELRSARYQILSRQALELGCRSIVTAHNQDDDAEGYVMSLLGVGGGQMGAAMKPVDHLGDIRLLRPFLSLPKSDLSTFLTLHGYTDFVQDNFDAALKNERARLRHSVLPTLARVSPGLAARLQKHGIKQGQQNEAIHQIAENLLTFGPDFYEATILMHADINAALLEAAIKMALKKLAPGSDMRASGPTLSQVMENYFPLGANHRGLDRPINLFKVKKFAPKQYQFPGVVLWATGEKLVLNRI
jgi:tRNA(Ile)-lysidine synthetase-like protein